MAVLLYMLLRCTQRDIDASWGDAPLWLAWFALIAFLIVFIGVMRVVFF